MGRFVRDRSYGARAKRVPLVLQPVLHGVGSISIKRLFDRHLPVTVHTMFAPRTLLTLFLPLVLLLVPLVFGAPWDAIDYIVGGALLLVLGIGLTFGMAVRSQARRALIILAILALLALVWGELAVGIFGTPFAGS